jgi:hypothetical protein
MERDPEKWRLLGTVELARDMISVTVAASRAPTG